MEKEVDLGLNGFKAIPDHWHGERSINISLIKWWQRVDNGIKERHRLNNGHLVW